MIPAIRKSFNAAFTEEKYQNFLKNLNAPHPGAIEFRVAETPVFIDKAFTKKMMDACESIVDIITDPNFKNYTNRAIPKTDKVPNETNLAEMIAFDFGICINDKNELEPQLIEMQGFPTLLGFQVHFNEAVFQSYDLPSNFTPYLSGYDKQSYLKDFKEIVIGKHQPEEVILLEIEPHEQKTRVDFYFTQDYLGIQPVCITEVITEGKDLYYINEKTGLKTPIKRIYNRVIFDDLHAQAPNLGSYLDLTKEWNVEWVPHPNWFYRISKFTLPFIDHPYVPKTSFLNEIKEIPKDLENYVLKPLFSFAGQGVVIDVTPADIEKITDPENWILQKKVNYAAIVETPDEPAKAEIRVIYLWNEKWARPKAAINLARLSKGKMIGVRYNKDKEWVGGSICLFEG